MTTTFRLIAALLLAVSALGQASFGPSFGPTVPMTATAFAQTNVMGATNAAQLARMNALPRYVSTLADLATTSTTAGPSNVVVLDPVRGGPFIAIPGGTYAVNDFAVYTNTASGNVWIREEYLRGDELNVRWFGATGDGVTDDRSALTNAFAQATHTVDGVTRRFTVRVPSGRYVVTNTMEIPDQYAIIKGDGWESTVFDTSAMPGPVPVIWAKVAAPSLSDFSIVGDNREWVGFGTEATNNIGILVKPTDGYPTGWLITANIDRVRIATMGVGIYVQDASNVTIQRSYITDTKYGIQFDHFVNNSWVQNCRLNGTVVGYHFRPSTEAVPWYHNINVFRDNTVEGYVRAIYIQSPVWGQQIVANYHEDNDYDVVIAPLNGGLSAYNVNIEGNRFTGPTAAASVTNIVLQLAEQPRIVGNFLNAAGGAGSDLIHIASTVENAVVEGNWYQNKSTWSSNTRDLGLNTRILDGFVSPIEHKTLAALTNYVYPSDSGPWTALVSDPTAYNAATLWRSVPITLTASSTNDWTSNSTGNQRLLLTSNSQIVSNVTSGTTITLRFLTNATAGTIYTYQGWAWANENCTMNPSSSWTNTLWHTPRAITTTPTLFRVSFVNSVTNGPLFGRDNRDAATDWLAVSNVSYTASGVYYGAPDGVSIHPSAKSSSRAWRKTPVQNTYASKSITAVTDWLPSDSDVMLLDPDGNHTLTSVPTILPGLWIGQRITIIVGDSEANTVTLQDAGTLAGSLLELGDTSRAVAAKGILVLIWNGGSWVEQSFR